MIRWICRVKVNDGITSDGFDKLGQKSLEKVLQLNRLT